MDKPDQMMLLPVERAELPTTPLVRVNQPANLLAVSTANNTLNILANAAGMQLLGTSKPAQPSRPEASVSAPLPAPQVRTVVYESCFANAMLVLHPPDQCVISQARNAIQQAPLPRPHSPQPETDLVTVSERGSCYRVKEIECGRPAVQRGVQRLVFASSGTELLGAMHSGATFLWSRLKSVPGTTAESSGMDFTYACPSPHQIGCFILTQLACLQTEASGNPADLGFRHRASIQNLTGILSVA